MSFPWIFTNSRPKTNPPKPIKHSRHKECNPHCTFDLQMEDDAFRKFFSEFTNTTNYAMAVRDTNLSQRHAIHLCMAYAYRAGKK